jgi:GTP pyrophosphokinase
LKPEKADPADPEGPEGQGRDQYRIKREISIFQAAEAAHRAGERRPAGPAHHHRHRANCYVIMGAIHQRWCTSPAAGATSSRNQGNFYQSSTTVITARRVEVRIQIRTRGDAPQRREASPPLEVQGAWPSGERPPLEWFREMIDYHRTNPDRVLSHGQRDLTPNEIYVFTPKGKVVNLKAGSTPIDFAYAIHSEVGDHCKNAIVNEKLVPLRTKLSSGDVVEIVTQKNAAPSADWLKFAASTRAKRKIMAYLRRRRFASTTRGRRLWQKVFRECRRNTACVRRPRHRKRLQAIHYSDLGTFLQDVGGGKKVLTARR